MAQQGIELSQSVEDQVNTLAQAGQTVVYVALDQARVGLSGVSDVLRADAQQVVDQLQHMGLSVVMLTGDRKVVGDAIAAQLDLPRDQVIAEVTPKGKVDAIAKLQSQGQRVALVGDGINDAPALAQADVGITLNSGTDIAVETADVILMRDQLMGVVEAIHLSRATFNKIRQNLAWAFAYNLVGIPLAAGALLPTLGISLNPAFAGGLMAFSSVTVVLNSLLLKRHAARN